MKTYKIDLTVYAVVEPDGGGMHDVTIAYFEDASSARSFADSTSKGWPRSVKTISINHKYNVFESVADYWDNNANSKRNAALSKLTDEEKELLGISTL